MAEIIVVPLHKYISKEIQSQAFFKVQTSNMAYFDHKRGLLSPLN